MASGHRALSGRKKEYDIIEDVHAGKTCPTCGSAPGYSRITDVEMKLIMEAAVDKLYTLPRRQSRVFSTLPAGGRIWPAVYRALGRADVLS